MLVENEDNMYVGIQLVVTKASDFKTPLDCPTESLRNHVTADIKLADFTYVNGSISPSSILPNKDAVRYIPSSRIFDFDHILDDKYVTSENLVDNLFYTYSGKSGWCDSTDNLMIWDANSAHNTTTIEPTITQANFTTDESGNVHFVIPHKQQDAEILNSSNERVYYAPRDIPVPMANYVSGAPGMVTSEYTQVIKDLTTKINTYKEFTNGKQIMYLDVLSLDSDGNYVTVPEGNSFPKDLSQFNVGDYILVREDYTAVSSEDSSSAPSTMYFVLPGGVVSVAPAGVTTTKPAGLKLGVTEALWEGDGSPRPSPTSPTAEELLEIFNYTSYKGTTSDYFEIIYHNQDDTEQTPYYYPVSATGPKTWSEPVLLTGGIPLATDYQVGGFYNASTSSEYVDAGYVYLDDTGHLRVRDYALLRSGALAYQLGESYKIAANSTIEYIQAQLDEYINNRVAFLDNIPLTSTPVMIDIYIPLPEETGVINITNIDSRFGTGVYIHFTSDDLSKDYSNLIINISNCEKIRIDGAVTTLTNGPIINLFRTCLYYDASVINYIRNCDPSNARDSLFTNYSNFTGFEDLTLWYSRFLESDPELVVNGMEISQPDVSMVTEDVSFWDETISGDNHYSYALRSITLSASGKMIGCSLYVGNGSTHQDVTDVNTSTHTIIADKFILPQGSALNYPMACVNDPISVTGTFTNAYMASNGVDWIVTDTTFSAKSGVYSVADGLKDGSIAFNSATYLVPATYTNVDSIEAWGTNEYHIFYGGTTV
jgi:hypothetical protein